MKVAVPRSRGRIYEEETLAMLSTNAFPRLVAEFTFQPAGGLYDENVRREESNENSASIDFKSGHVELKFGPIFAKSLRFAFDP